MLRSFGIAVLSFFIFLFVLAAIRYALHQPERRAESATPTQSASAVQADVAPASEPTPDPPPHQTYSVATFTKSGDVLDECAELTFWTDKKIDKKKLQAFLKSSGVPLNQGCEESFPDRPVLASCVSSIAVGDAGLPIDVVEKYYNALMLDNNDTYLKQCLQVGGTWKAVPRDDPSYTRARLRGRVKDIQRAAEQMQRAVP